MEMKKLLDISSRQGEFFPEAAQAWGAEMVICRCSYGDIEDSSWSTAAPIVKDNNMKLGAYGVLTAHYEENATTLSEAMVVMRRQISSWIALCKEQNCAVLAISQKLERGHKMALGRAANTRLLQEAAAMVRKAGIIPLIHASPSWIISLIDWQAVNADWWVAHYQQTGVDYAQYCSTNSPVFPGFEAGKLLRSMYDNDRLFAWQYGRGGRMGERCSASSNYVNRSLIYKTLCHSARLVSDMLMIDLSGLHDVSCVTSMANELNLRCKKVDDSLILGPMTSGDRERVSRQAKMMGVPCEDYFPPIEVEKPRKTPSVMEADEKTAVLMNTLARIEAILTRHDEQLSSIDETSITLLDMYITAANSILG